MSAKMLCCGGDKESGRDLKSAQNTPSRQPMNMPATSYSGGGGGMATIGGPKGLSPPPLTQAARLQQQAKGGGMQQHINSFDLRDDFKKQPSGISEEVFRQLETVQNRYDSSTAAAFRVVQKSGEMVVRTLDPRQFIRLASETAPKINIDTNDPNSLTSFVEIVKRPGQTLGLYIREGNGLDRHDGVFISRIAIDSAVYSSGCLQLGDEILAVNLVDVTRMSLDDVVIIMSIPRRLVLTTRRSKNRIPGQGGFLASRENGGNHGGMDGGKMSPPVVVYKGGAGGNGGGNYRGDFEVDSPRGSGGYMPYRDARTLTWDRNPKPDRNDPKYFPVNSLPRNQQQNSMMMMQQQQPRMLMSAAEEAGYSSREIEALMPPPMRELNTVAGYPPMILTPRSEYLQQQQQQQADYNDYYSNDSDSGGPGRGQRLLHRMASEPSRYRGGGGGRHQSGLSPTSASDIGASSSRRSYTLQYPSRQQQQYPRSSMQSSQQQQSSSRTRHFSGLDYASDTEALLLQSPVSSSVRMSRSAAVGRMGMASSARSSSLPRTFQREALLRHPELSMEMDRLADPAAILSGLCGTDDQLSDSGAISAPESVITARKRGYRSPSSFSHLGHDVYARTERLSLGHIYPTTTSSSGKEIRRTPSTSAIYETLRRSKELRESLSRPSSRLSIDNIPDKIRDIDTQYFSDSEHQMVSNSYAQRQEMRRMRNRTLSGLDSMRLVGEHQRPSSAASGIRPITPSFQNEKENGQNFVNFNPADFIKYKSEVIAENGGGLRLSGILNLHLLSGRGLRTAGRARRIRDLYCVVEVDHIHKARTVVRSGGINFDWDERFELDLVNNLEVEFLVYSWDPQLRHRLCYRSSLRLATLFGKGQTFQQVALRLHPTGTLYLTLAYVNLHEAYDRARYCSRPNQKLFGVNLENVLERESGRGGLQLVPVIIKRCVEEIERRGMDIIGIYRLCGADAKKNMLRMAFEEDDPDMVDLSSANVPDINVITGLIKEYLRELPQPVFSNCLYQMLVDAMGVFLPDDPDGNAKLVFSILDCLPKANRNFLMYVMDHLSKITSQAARNKMSAQNLSICFAPVLMLDFSQQVTAVHDVHNISEPINILTYLIEIWPKAQE